MMMLVEQNCDHGDSNRRTNLRYILEVKPNIYADVVAEGSTEIKGDSQEFGLRNWLCGGNI